MSSTSDPRRRRYGLGREYSEDERDLKFPMEAILGGAPGFRHLERFYNTGPVMDQGESSMCVGYTLRGFLFAAPLMTTSGPSEAEIYRQAQMRDPWKTIPHNGTTLRAGLEYLRELGRIASYHWAWQPGPARDWLLGDLGTVVAGLPWTREMFSPRGDGFVRPQGPVIGGHAVLLVGYSTERGAFRGVNSWGEEWGQEGRFWLAEEDLLHMYSLGPLELVTAVEQLPTIPPPAQAQP